MLAFMTAALGSGARIAVPSAVVEPLSASLAKLAGETLRDVRGATVVDAIVVASAARRGDVVLTSDVDDLSRIRDIAFPSVRIRRVG